MRTAQRVGEAVASASGESPRASSGLCGERGDAPGVVASFFWLKRLNTWRLDHCLRLARRRLHGVRHHRMGSADRLPRLLIPDLPRRLPWLTRRSARR